jgi:hypothetical protein
LHAGEALEVMDVIEPHQAEDLAHPRDRAQQGERVGVVVRGRAAAGQFHGAEPLVVVADQGPIDLATLLDCGCRKPLGHANAVRCVGARLPNLGQVILAVGLLDRGQQLRPCAPQMHPPPEQIPCGAHGGRIDIRLGEHPATEQDRNFLCVELVVCSVATRDGFPIERVPEDTRHPCARTEVGQPRPGEEAFDADDESGPVGCHGLETRFWASRHMPVDKTLAILVQDAEGPWCGHADRCHSNIGVVSWRIALRSPPLLRSFFPTPADHVVCGGGGLNKYQGAAGDGLQRSLVPRSRFQPRLSAGVGRRALAVMLPVGK